MTENKKYTIEDLKQHQSNEDMWLLINGKGISFTNSLINLTRQFSL